MILDFDKQQSTMTAVQGNGLISHTGSQPSKRAGDLGDRIGAPVRLKHEQNNKSRDACPGFIFVCASELALFLRLATLLTESRPQGAEHQRFRQAPRRGVGSAN